MSKLPELNSPIDVGKKIKIFTSAFRHLVDVFPSLRSNPKLGDDAILGPVGILWG